MTWRCDYGITAQDKSVQRQLNDAIVEQVGFNVM